MKAKFWFSDELTIKIRASYKLESRLVLIGKKSCRLMAFCPECGTKNEDAAMFCGNCGTNMNFNSQQTYDPAPAKPAYQDPAPGKPAYQDPARPSYTPPANPQPQGYAQSGPYAHQQQLAGGRAQRVVNPPAVRSWGLWFLASIFLFGIPYLVYSYLILEDLNKLEYNSTHRGNIHYPSKVNTAVGILLLIFFFPGYFYIKFNSLHEHLTRSHNAIDKPMSGTTYVILLVASFFLIWTFVVPFGVAIYFLYQEYKWQYVMNHHIRLHGLSFK